MHCYCDWKFNTIRLCAVMKILICNWPLTLIEPLCLSWNSILVVDSESKSDTEAQWHHAPPSVRSRLDWMPGAVQMTCDALIWLSTLSSVQFLRTMTGAMCNDSCQIPWHNAVVKLSWLSHCHWLCSLWGIGWHVLDCFHLLVLTSKLRLLDWWIACSNWIQTPS
jgi:hypothetical protein